MSDRALWIVCGGTVCMVVGLWISTELGARAVTQQNDSLHEMLDDVERDIGVYDPSHRDQAASVRARRLAETMRDEAKLRIEEVDRNIAMIESLQTLDREEMGVQVRDADTPPNPEIEY